MKDSTHEDLSDVISVATRATFALSPDEAWRTLSFYEQLEERPPFYLRLLLPVPIRTEGEKSRVGDEARCVYANGHLVKRVTEVEPGRHLAFAVVEQQLNVGGGILLAGGSYTLRPSGNGHTEVELLTRYRGRRRPRWLWTPIEEAVCHLFHRHILRGMRAGAPSGSRSDVVGPRAA
jgi:hypothetical protein